MERDDSQLNIWMQKDRLPYSHRSLIRCLQPSQAAVLLSLLSS